MTQYDNEFFRGPPEGSPTLATDQRPTGAEVFQAKPEKATASADVPVTREEVPKDPPKKKSNARRITKAIKLLASCMAAVVITEAATNIAATIEPPAPEEVPTGQYYVGQWPAVLRTEGSGLVLDLDTVDGNIIQTVLEGKAWRFAAKQDWRMLWLDNNLFIEQISTGISGRLNMRLEPYMYAEEGAAYGAVTASTGETLYFRGFMKGGGTGAPGESMELQQAAMDDFIDGLTVTLAIEDGWQGLQIGRKIYSQLSEDWYGLGGHGDLEIEIPWVCHSEDYDLQDMTPYAREKVNGITWSIYFAEAEHDTFLWAVPNIDPGLCLGGPVSRFMYADAMRRGEEQEADEWLEKGGSVSMSQRQTAVDILIECLQHHYALRDRWYPRDWPWKGATDDHATYWVWAESMRGKWIQFSFGDEAYRVDCTDSELRFHWERTTGTGDDAIAELEISRMVRNEEEWAIDLSVCRAEFQYVNPECVYMTTHATGGEVLYLCFRPQHHGGGADFTTAELQPMANEILDALEFQSNPDDSGWSTMLLCDTMHSPQTMEWSGSGIVGTYNEIRYIHEIQVEGLENETPCATRTHNGITWSFHYDVEEKIIWAVPDLEPDVCIGANVSNMHDYYRQRNPDMVTGGWNVQYDVPYDDVNHAVEAFSECLSHIYPLGVEPTAEPSTERTEEDDAVLAGTAGGSGQFSLGYRGYRLIHPTESADMEWWFTRCYGHDHVMAAEVNVQAYWNGNCMASLLIAETPMSQYDDQPHGQIPVSDGGMLYWYCTYVHSGDETQVAGVMSGVTAAEPIPDEWGHIWIENSVYSQKSLYWSGWESVDPEGGRTVMMWNLERTASLELGDPIAQREINGILWTLYVMEEYSEVRWPFIWAVPDVDPTLAIGSDYENAVYKYYEDHGMIEDFNGDIWTAESRDGAAEMIFEVLYNYYPQ